MSCRMNHPTSMLHLFGVYRKVSLMKIPLRSVCLGIDEGSILGFPMYLLVDVIRSSGVDLILAMLSSPQAISETMALIKVPAPPLRSPIDKVSSSLCAMTRLLSGIPFDFLASGSYYSTIKPNKYILFCQGDSAS